MISKRNHTLVSIKLFSYKQETQHCWLNTALLLYLPVLKTDGPKDMIYIYIYMITCIHICMKKYVYIQYIMYIYYGLIIYSILRVRGKSCQLSLVPKHFTKPIYSSYPGTPQKGCFCLSLFRTSQTSRGDPHVPWWSPKSTEGSHVCDGGEKAAGRAQGIGMQLLGVFNGKWSGRFFPRWWFQIFFSFTRGKVSNLTNIFSNGFQMGWNHAPAAFLS